MHVGLGNVSKWCWSQLQEWKWLCWSKEWHVHWHNMGGGRGVDTGSNGRGVDTGSSGTGTGSLAGSAVALTHVLTMTKCALGLAHLPECLPPPYGSWSVQFHLWLSLLMSWAKRAPLTLPLCFPPHFTAMHLAVSGQDSWSGAIASFSGSWAITSCQCNHAKVWLDWMDWFHQFWCSTWCLSQ